MHPDDAGARGLVDGKLVWLESRRGSIEVLLEVTDAVMRGVVSLPYGWGHGRSGVQLSVASRHCCSDMVRKPETRRPERVMPAAAACCITA